MTSNPYALTDYEQYWADGYVAGQNSPAKTLFPKPPDTLTSSDQADKWKEGWKAGRADAKAGISGDPATGQGQSSQLPSTPPPPSAGGGEHVWNFTFNGKTFEHVSTDAAEKALVTIADGLERRIEYVEGYQIEFNKAASSHIMNAIIETASGFHYQPKQDVWGKLKPEVAAIKSAASSGQIADAVAKADKASTDVEAAAHAWFTFLDQWDKGGTNTIEALGTVVKVSIMVEAVAATALTGGGAAAGAGIGAGNSGLTEMADQFVAQAEGKQHDFDWAKIGEEALIGAIVGGAGGAAEGPWAEALAEEAPGIVGAKTALLEKIAPTFIDSETGVAMTASQLAVKMEPLWGKAVTKIPFTVLKGIVHKLLAAGIEGKGDKKTIAATIIGDLQDDTIQMIIEQTLKEASMIK
jgi:hypothetical protein